ncbi:hypothetical protein GCM10010172_40630 [Paractinoplanes ferrugineus]
MAVVVAEASGGPYPVPAGQTPGGAPGGRSAAWATVAAATSNRPAELTATSDVISARFVEVPVFEMGEM